VTMLENDVLVGRDSPNKEFPIIVVSTLPSRMTWLDKSNDLA
jgi:hypothetical protein